MVGFVLVSVVSFCCIMGALRNPSAPIPHDSLQHVGTNNVSSSQSLDTILSYYGDLIHKIKSKTDAKIIFTSLLPRLVNFKLSERKLNKVNSELRGLCNRRSLLFCNLYRSFLHNNKPDSSFYPPKDGLYLNFSITELFRKKIIFIIKHLSL